LTEEGILRAQALPRLIKNGDISDSNGILLGEEMDL
jgi:hypothetical protein